MQPGRLGLYTGVVHCRRCTARIVLTAIIVLVAGGPPLRASSLEMAFLRGLREHGLYDYALVEIDRLKAQPHLSPEMATTLDFERAITQLQAARTLVNATSQARELQRAAAELEKFSNAHPNSPQRATADFERANLHLDEARAALAGVTSQDPQFKRETAQKKARKLIDESRVIFQTVFDRSKAEYEKFPKTRLDDPKASEARSQAESSYMGAQIMLGVCSYEEGRTYDPKSDDFKKTLDQAVKQFDQIMVTYRTQGAGLRAQFWQGRCFEEMGKTTEALGIYSQLSQKQGTSNFIKQLRDDATMAHLSCLNSKPGKNDFIVVNEATNWLAATKDRLRTPVGLAIRWQRAVASEHLAAAKDSSPADRDRLLHSAADDAREVSRVTGEFQTPAVAMLGRLRTDTVSKRAEARDFVSGFALATKSVEAIQALHERLESASADDKPKIERELQAQLRDARQKLMNVMSTADLRRDPKDLNRARYYLAFVEYELKDYDAAAVLGDYAARRLKTIDGEWARDAAHLSLAALDQEFKTCPESQRPVLARIARPTAEFLIHNWPDQDRANEARAIMAELYDQSKQPLEAAQWYASVTPGSDGYAEAQIGAGREYWSAALSAPKAVAGGPSREAQIKEWTASAEKHLQNGIAKAGDPADSAGNPPAWLVSGKTVLANLEIGLGNYDEAVRLLTDGAHSVTASIAVNDETTRPSAGVKNKTFASFVYQSLLRGQIGRHQVDAAIGAMQQLEKIAGTSGVEGVTAIYVSLGKEIEKEIARLIASNARQRLIEVRKSFDRFLEELTKRSQTMSYGSLLWIAETYTGLGEGISDDESSAHEYFGKAAAAYEQILAKTASDPSPAAKERVLSFQLRLANSRRRQGDYEHALEIVRSVIAQRPKTLEVQITAAGILQDWGASQSADAERRSLEAIRGLHDGEAGGNGVVWGWAEIAARIQRVLAGGKADNDLREKYFDARYNIPACRRQCALVDKDRAMRSKILEVALGEIRAFSLVSSDVGEDSWKRLDSLYQQIETDLGRQPTPLARPDLRATAVAATPGATPAAAAVSPAIPTAAGTPTAAAPPPAAKTASAPAPSGTSPFWLLLGFLALATVSAGGMWWGLGRQKTHRKTLPSFAADDDVALPSRPARPAGAPVAARPTRTAAPRTAPVGTEKPGAAPVKATAPRPPRPKPKDQ
jgi:cellulose synthase operon protein C